MVKRKATASRITSAKTARRTLSQLNLSSSTSTQTPADVRKAQPATDESLSFPPSPPPAHPNYTHPTPRQCKIRLSTMVSLSLHIKSADEPTKVPQVPAVESIPAVNTTASPKFISSFTVEPLDDSPSFTLRPVFAWPQNSGDNESEAESDGGRESIHGVGGDPEPCEPVEQTVDDAKAHAVNSAGGDLINNENQEKKYEENQEGEKEGEAEELNHPDKEPEVEKNPATSEEHPAATAEGNFSGVGV